MEVENNKQTNSIIDTVDTTNASTSTDIVNNVDETKKTTTPNVDYKPYIIVPLDDVFNSTDNKRSIMMKVTFQTLYKLTDNNTINGYLQQTLGFYNTTLQSREKLASDAMIRNIELNIDNHLLLLFDKTRTSSSTTEGEEEDKNNGYTNEDIIGFILYYKGRESVTISQCAIKKEYRRKNMGSTMVMALFERYLNSQTGIKVIKVDVIGTLEALKFFIRFGFTIEKRELMCELKTIVSNGDVAVLNNKAYDDQFKQAKVKNPNGSYHMVYYARYCMTCKDMTKKTSRCVGCFKVSYCSVECQAKDFKLHKQTCLRSNK